jgi:hypothetical protein
MTRCDYPNGDKKCMMNCDYLHMIVAYICGALACQQTVGGEVEFISDNQHHERDLSRHVASISLPLPAMSNLPSLLATPVLPPYSDFMHYHSTQPSPSISPINKINELPYITEDGHVIHLSHPITFLFLNHYPDCPFSKLTITFM